ncbi:MAG: FAD-binding protein [Balneolaceae bacterium]|nr:FAD-binding protein [Balneolaceae bacterium]
MDKRTFLKITSIAVTGTMFNPPFLYRPDQEIGSNWAGNYHYKAKELHEPGNVADVQGLVKKSDKVSVLGSRHSFNSIADTSQNLLSVANFKQIGSLNSEDQTVTAGGGIKYGDLALFLQENGFALHNLASLPHISVAGACATATHGSGITNGNLATAIAGLQIVNGNGDIVNLSRDQDGERFNRAVVGLGALGMVTNVTLDVEPTYNMQQYVYQGLPLQHLEDHFNEIMSAGYSVSLFTDWKGDTVNQVWIKRRMDGKGTTDEADSTFFDATLADDHLHPIADVSAENCTRQMGIPGPWHERLPHFRMDFTPQRRRRAAERIFCAPRVRLRGHI